MKVILKDDIPGLGEMGDVVSAAGGFARNFLLPRSLAVIADKGNMNRIDSLKKKKVIKREKQKKEAMELVEKMSSFSCTMQVKVGENEKMFGSVTTAHIAEKLATAGYEIDKKKINLLEPIKKLGVYSVQVKIHQDVSADIKVWVVDENEGKKEKTDKPETTGEAVAVEPEAAVPVTETSVEKTAKIETVTEGEEAEKPEEQVTKTVVPPETGVEASVVEESTEREPVPEGETSKKTGEQAEESTTTSEAVASDPEADKLTEEKE